MHVSGGCLCGQLRYAIDGDVIDAGFCHCRLCQRSSGAPTVAWLTLPVSGFCYTRGRPAVFASSEKFQREFCAACGTQIAFRAIQAPKTIDVTLGSLDQPSAIAPQYHIWCQSRVSWLHINDELPQYQDAGPDGES